MPIILLVPILLPYVSAQPVIHVSALNHEFSGLPGDTLVIPFNVTNLGNETLSNFSVYLSGPAEGFLYQTKVIREPLGPGGSISDTIVLKILNAGPGLYTVRLVARVGEVYSEDVIHVRVKTLMDFRLTITADDRYIYGKEKDVLLEISSRSNGILSGRVGYSLEGPGGRILNVTTVTYVRPGGSWRETVPIKGLSPGRYTVSLWANFSGVYRETRRTFEIYQRNLTYRAYYKGGAIYVRILEGSAGVGDIDVYINGAHFTTDENGLVEYPVTGPGTYGIVMNLDGRIERTSVEVQRLTVDVGQLKDELWVRVRNPSGPVPNVTVVVSGPEGTAYCVTNTTGAALVNLNKTGYGTLMVRAESDRYLPGEATIKVIPPETETPTTTTPTTTTAPLTTATTPAKPPRNYGPLAAILLIAGAVLAGSSYVAFFRPIVQEETLDRYYFVKVKAPRLRGVDNFRFEKGVNAVVVRATKGNAKIGDGKVVWEIDHLEPEEEAYLQVILG
nr:hypothetical protein [Thermococcus sp. 21S7]